MEKLYFIIVVVASLIGEGNGNPLQYSCRDNPTNTGGLAGYSPWGHKEPNMIEWLSVRHTNVYICRSSVNYLPQIGEFYCK